MSTSTRFSKMELYKIYFTTITVNKWKQLLKQDKYKNLIIDLFCKQVFQLQSTIYGFVIMPNHIHLIWKLNKMNGREKPNASFNKATAHLITKDLKVNHPNVLPHFVENTTERNYRIWKRDSMSIEMDCIKKVEQKLDYIHNNPLADKWNLASAPENYYWSSAAFYETGANNFTFLTDYREAF